jgi:hypothetical protein
MKVAFDCDNTLVVRMGKITEPRDDILSLFNMFKDGGHELYLWSGGGVAYANSIKDLLKIDAKVVEKGSFRPDVAVDDEDCFLGTKNIKVDPPSLLFMEELADKYLDTLKKAKL